ncbi:hypothetical protein BDY19DRAFT_111108 [Irpex rosettiformis]|uniref:Uncharacterized protein n=1 Tax=Irpex rosettiformis TaxID=378272 RepID=A0ACB8U5V6_9APHY|nr:hypothetical protein BDY19DRAFT_111108 [Irpex rosettiformis]
MSPLVNAILRGARVADTPGAHGMLRRMLDMPLEICTHLDNNDMLRLARLSKAFRVLLMSRSTEFVWRAARLNDPNLPPCPDDITEVAYANLLYDPTCHVTLRLPSV